MIRLGKAFAKAKAEGRPALVAYVMASDPDNERCLDYARAILEEADVLEIGVPFSDPVADGPVIERAAVRALAKGACPTRASRAWAAAATPWAPSTASAT